MAESKQWGDWLRVPLYNAAANAQAAVVSQLISAGANASAGFRDHRGSTLIHAAASGGSLEILSAFLDAGCSADLDIRESRPPRRTPLHTAVCKGHRDMAKALIAAGGDPKAADYTGQAPLHLASIRGHTGIVSDLLELGCLDVNTRDVDGFTPLALAVVHRSMDILKLLLEVGASPVMSSATSLNALDVALRENRVDCMQELLAAGADPEAVDPIGLTPLLSATRRSNVPAIAALIEAGADVDGRGGTVWTPLHFAAHVGDVEAIEALVVRGGNLSARAGLKGETPLHIAAGYADSRAVKELIQRWEADETALDARGQSAHDIAGHLIYNFDRGHRHEEEVQLIRTILENAPAEKKWMRRRAGVMLVTRERQRFSRERLRLAESGAKKRGAQGGDGVPDVIAAAPPVAVVNGGSVAKEEAATPTTQFVEGGEGEGGGGGLLSPGMVLFRDAVLRLAEMDDEGIFRTVIGFL